ncbi:MAG TPA: hypothetical protein DF613_13515 [Lachnospiraceae bacterium]|nr:hypothetical protein [Lachnospiraceae bacterium]
MKKIARCMFAVLAVVLTAAVFGLPVKADYEPKPTSVKAVGSKTRTVKQGQEFELKVRTNPRNADDDYLRWSIVKGKGVVRFEDSDRDGDDIDLVAVKAGTAKVRCKISGSNKSVTFTIKVKKSSVKKTIQAVGSRSRTVNAGQEFELKVRTSANVPEDDLVWSIVKGTKVVAFEDDDIYDDEVDLVALKEGSAQVRCKIQGTAKSVTFSITVKGTPAASTITRKGPAERTILLGQEFELEVQRSYGLSEKYLEWDIEDESVLIFEDGYAENDDEAELIAIGEGTTTVTCTNTLTGKSVSFTIHVIGSGYGV